MPVFTIKHEMPDDEAAARPERLMYEKYQYDDMAEAM